MALISTWFFVFLIASLIIYYILPIKIRCVALCLSSAVYMYFAGGILGTIVLASFVILGILFAKIMQSQFFSGEARSGLKRLVYIISMLLPVAALLLFKYINPFGIEAPMGIAFYLMTFMGFMTDAYQGAIREKISPVGAGLIIGFFPMMTSGPIVRYGENAANIKEGHKLCYINILHGIQRILWGTFKKLVISERCAVIVNTVYAAPDTFSSAFLVFAIFAFVLQLYTDFSGCMDIVVGAAEMFGIKLPENFDTPFFSRNVSEFWRRWHITLGAWLKDYVMYPVLHSELFRKFKKACKNKMGKKHGEKPALYLSMFISWTIIGYWHGGSLKYIFGVGWWFLAIIVLGELLSPFFGWIKRVLKIRTNNTSYHIFESLRTLMFVGVGLSFFRAASFSVGIDYWKCIFTNAQNQKGMLFSNDIYSLGLDLQDILVLIVAFIILLLVSIIQYKNAKKGISVRGWLDQQNLVFRWVVYIILIFAVVIFGKYGQGYNAADFIYQGF